MEGCEEPVFSMVCCGWLFFEFTGREDLNAAFIIPVHFLFYGWVSAFQLRRCFDVFCVSSSRIALHYNNWNWSLPFCMWDEFMCSVVVAAVNEGWFISFVRTVLKFGHSGWCYFVNEVYKCKMLRLRKKVCWRRFPRWSKNRLFIFCDMNHVLCSPWGMVVCFVGKKRDSFHRWWRLFLLWEMNAA